MFAEIWHKLATHPQFFAMLTSICDSSRDLGACMDGAQDAILSHSFLGD